MAKESKDPKRSAAQLREMRRRWRQGVWIHIGLAVLAGLGVGACRYFDAHRFWWFVCIAATVSGLIGLFADVNAYHDTKKRVAALENKP